MRKTFGDKLAAIVSDVANSGAKSQKVRNAHDFITNKTYGLGMNLFPGQSVILKANYGIPLDDVHKFDINNWDGTLIGRFTEADLLKYWYDDIDKDTGFGRSNIRVVEEGHELTTMIYSLGRRSGKCPRKGTLVLTEAGIAKIEDLGNSSGDEYQPLEITVAQEGTKRAKSAYFYNGGVKPYIGYRTRCGYELEATANHRVKVLSEEGLIEWRYLDEIKIGDVICIHRTSDLWSPSYVDIDFTTTKNRAPSQFPAILDEKWGLLLGCLVGDGSWTNKSSVEITIEHLEFLEIVKDLYRTCFQSEPNVYLLKESDHTVHLQMRSAAWREFLHHLGFDWNCKRDNKKIPWSIMKSPKSVVAKFLSGLFETDGCAEKNGQAITFSSASERLCFEIQTLLLNFGIVSRRKKRWNKKTEKFYHYISIRGRSSKKIFLEEIGFMTQKKNAPLIENLLNSKREGGDTESIPHQKKWVLKLGDEVSSKTRRSLGNCVKTSSLENITYCRLKRVKEEAQEAPTWKHFQHLLDCNYFFDPVVEMWTGEDNVYDLNVPDGASFVANGMTNHNTTLCAAVVAYESYKLIKKGNPQQYYGTTPGDQIQLASLATAREQAKLLFNGVTSHLGHCAFFKPYMANNTQQMVMLQTPADIETYGRYADDEKAKASIKITFLSSNAAGIRGSGNIVCILDEVAFFPEKGKGASEDVFQAMSPSLAAFSEKDPNDPLTPVGPAEGRMLMISSPAGKQGLFYKKYEQAMRGQKGSENMLAISAPTWEINKSILTSFFVEERARDPRAFTQEFGSRFSDRTLGFLESEDDFLACIEPQARKRLRGQPRIQYFMGSDLAQVRDASAVAITHVEGDKIILDCAERIQAGWGEYENVVRLETEWITEWIHSFYDNFAIHQGIADQHHAAVFMSPLERMGIKNFEFKKWSPTDTTDMWKQFKSLMFDKRFVFYDIAESEKQRRLDNEEDVPLHEDYIMEFLSLQQKNKSKNIFEVSAPFGRHDDLADAVVRSIFLAAQSFTSKKLIIGNSTGYAVNEMMRQNAAMRAKNTRRARVKARLGGSHPSRMVPRR